MRKTVTLGNVCRTLHSGKGIRASEVSASGKFPVIGGNGIRGYCERLNFNGDCAVVGRQGAACGNVRYFNGEAYMTEHAVIVQGDDTCSNRYLAYLLGTMSLGRLSGQSAQPGLSVKTLSKQEIELPPRETQEAVVAILGKLDDKIEANSRLNDYLAA